MMSEVTLYMFKMCFTTAPPGRALMTSCLRGKEREREREFASVCEIHREFVRVSENERECVCESACAANCVRSTTS
jgi:hypothetical protein